MKRISVPRFSISLVSLTIVTILTLLMIFSWGERAQSTNSKIGWSLKDYPASPIQPILIILKNQANLRFAQKIENLSEKKHYVFDSLMSVAELSQGPLVQRLSGNFQFQRFYIQNMIAVFDATPALITELALREDVARIISNEPVLVVGPRIRLLDSVPAGVNDSIQVTGAEKVWNELGVKGKGIVVAGQDTGVDWIHPALRSSYRGTQGTTADHNYNWHDAIHDGSGTNPCGRNSKMPCDDNAHGTHTVGTITGDDGNTAKIGMSPDSKWIACRNMDKGYGTPARYIECFEYFLAPYPFGQTAFDGGADPLKAPHVINNSWGCPPSEGCEGGEILPVLEAIKASGIFAVVSAGNAGPMCSTIADPPAHHSAATFSVGAHDHRRDIIAGFSSRGPSAFDGQVGPDVVAPGVNILSAVPNGRYEQFGWSGTSMAGPHVVGVVALMWSANPKLIGKIEETTEMIRKTSKPKTTTESCGGIDGSVIPNNTYGYGFIDAFAAVQAALQFN